MLKADGTTLVVKAEKDGKLPLARRKDLRSPHSSQGRFYTAKTHRGRTSIEPTSLSHIYLPGIGYLGLSKPGRPDE